MNIEQKKALLAQLSTKNPYIQILDSIKNKDEQYQVKAFIEDVYLNLIEGILIIENIID